MKLKVDDYEILLMDMNGDLTMVVVIDGVEYAINTNTKKLEEIGTN
jgi:hypothetical protein